jgi:hypothetical protein
MLERILTYLWERRTTVLGYLVVVLGYLATSDQFSKEALGWIILANGLVTAILGHYNNSRIQAHAAQAVRVDKEEQ